MNEHLEHSHCGEQATKQMKLIWVNWNAVLCRLCRTVPPFTLVFLCLNSLVLILEPPGGLLLGLLHALGLYCPPEDLELPCPPRSSSRQILNGNYCEMVKHLPLPHRHRLQNDTILMHFYVNSEAFYHH